MSAPNDPSLLASPPDLATLARRVAAGSADAPEAEAELARHFARRIRLYGLRHLRDGAAADDLVQHVLLVVIERLRAGGVREPERLASFVLGVCRMTVRDMRRADWKREAAHRAQARDAALAAGPPEMFDAARLAACLNGLAPRDRLVVVLTFYADRTTDQIAAELSLASGNVRVIRHRALERLRQCMDRRPEAPRHG